MEYKYDVGDAVVVKQDLKTGCNYFMEPDLVGVHTTMLSTK